MLFPRGTVEVQLAVKDSGKDPAPRVFTCPVFLSIMLLVMSMLVGQSSASWKSEQ